MFKIFDLIVDQCLANKQTRQKTKEQKLKKKLKREKMKIIAKFFLHPMAIKTLLLWRLIPWFFGHIHMWSSAHVCTYIAARGQSVMFLRSHSPCLVTQGQSSRHVACQLCLAVLSASSRDLLSPPSQERDYKCLSLSLYCFHFNVGSGDQNCGFTQQPFSNWAVLGAGNLLL